MKKLFIFTLTSFLLGACSVEEDFQANDSAVIKLTSSINPMTRGTSLDQQSTQIEAGREVGVIINGAKSEHTNVSWSVEEDGTLTNTGNTLYWGNSDVTIYAYHPYNSNWAGTNTNESFSVSTDQSGDGYLDSDLLWVSKTQSKTTEAIALTFTHKLAKINVTLTSDDIDDLSDATISICGTNTDTNFNPITGTLSNVTTTNVQDIKAGVTTSDAYTASAIIIPQTVAANTKLIKVEHNSKVYYYTLSADKEFTTGKSYSFKLKVKEQLVELTSVSDNITDWDSEDEENEGDAEENSSILTVTLSEAGTLGNYLTEENKNTITELKIIGNINGTDIQLIRDITEHLYSTTEPAGVLSVLDLSEANIVAGGNPYKGVAPVQEISTQNNIVTDQMFEYTNLKTIHEINFSK